MSRNKNLDLEDSKVEDGIERASKLDFHALLELWESSVRATHHFLSEQNIEQLRPIVLEQAFPNVEMFLTRDRQGKIAGFIGVDNQSVEMLFISPHCFRQGIGKKLMYFAENQLATNKVDVNEQNPDALKFYLALGYEVKNRSPLDGQGNPFPILHLEK